MKTPPGILCMDDSEYRGARILIIEKVPAFLEDDPVSEILAKCRQSSASVELLAVSDSQIAGKLNISLIFRRTGAHPYAILRDLDALVLSVRNSLQQRGFLCAVIPQGMTAKEQLSLPEGKRVASVCFYPPEGASDKIKGYVPGQYRSAGMPPVDLAGLMPVLASHPGSLLILQANPTRIYAQEKKVIQSQYTRLTAIEKVPMAKTAAEVYKSYQTLSEDPGGVWQISFLGAGTSAYTSDLTARASLCSIRASHFSFTMPPSGTWIYLGDKLLANTVFRQGHEAEYREKLPAAVYRLTHLCSLSDFAGSFPVPQDLSGIGGLEINHIVSSSEPLPESMARPDGIHLGRYQKTGQDIYISVKDLTRHGIITGKPGSGKTVFALGLLYLLQKHENHYPFLAFEPAKKEYRSLLELIPDLQIYTPGNQGLSPLYLNIFLPPKGVTREQYQPVVESIFSLAVTMTHPLDVIFPQVISRCYARYGWRPDSTRDDKGVRIFGLHEFICEFRRFARGNYGYNQDDLHNIETGGLVRLEELRSQPFFDTNESIDIETLLTRPTVIELDALSNNRQRAVVMGTLLFQIMAFLRQRGTSSSGLRNLILIDEAHLLLDQNESGNQGSSGTPQAQSTVLEQLQNMILILRAYGTSMIFGDQSASRLSSSIVGNVNLKMMFRMDSLADRQILREEAKMTQEMTNSMISLPSGHAYMSCDQISDPVYLVVPNYEENLHLNKQLPDDLIRRHMNVSLSAPYYQCSICPQCKGRCDYATRKDAHFIAGQLMDHPFIQQTLDQQVSASVDLPDFLWKQLPQAAKEIAEKFFIETSDFPRLAACARVHMIRELLLRPECLVAEEVLMTEPEEEESE